MEIKSRRNTGNKSYGLSISETRLELLNNQLNIPVAVEIIDLHDEQNYAAGTQAEIHMPLHERF